MAGGRCAGGIFGVGLGNSKGQVVLRYQGADGDFIFAIIGGNSTHQLRSYVAGAAALLAVTFDADHPWTPLSPTPSRGSP
jgi:cell division protein FtsW (lipid II flippase)